MGVTGTEMGPSHRHPLFAQSESTCARGGPSACALPQGPAEGAVAASVAVNKARTPMSPTAFERLSWYPAVRLVNPSPGTAAGRDSTRPCF